MAVTLHYYIKYSTSIKLVKQEMGSKGNYCWYGEQKWQNLLKNFNIFLINARTNYLFLHQSLNSWNVFLFTKFYYKMCSLHVSAIFQKFYSILLNIICQTSRDDCTRHFETKFLWKCVLQSVLGFRWTERQS